METSEAPAVSLDEWTKYCEDTVATKRRPTRTVWAGKVPIGSEHRIARQTMTTTNTNDVDATVAQARVDGVMYGGHMECILTTQGAPVFSSLLGVSWNKTANLVQSSKTQG